MLKHIFSNPIRVFIVIASLGLLGIYCGLKLPIALYPQSSRPVIQMSVGYGGYSVNEFIKKFGANFEAQLEGIKNTGLKIYGVEGEYNSNSVNYTITYDWQVPYGPALKEVQNLGAAFKGILPKESADSLRIWQGRTNSGFLAVSFFSDRHSLNHLYELLEPILGPDLRKNPDSEDIGLWNPESREISIKLLPENLATYDLLPREVFSKIEGSLPSLTGGHVKMGTSKVSFDVPTSLTGVESLENLSLGLSNGKRVFLKDVAVIQIGKSEKQNRSFKTNGKESLILFAEPKSGANVKRMAESVLDLIKKKQTLFPEGVDYRVLVDPSEFIRGSVRSLISDVILAAFLAVLVLFLFIGNLKNVATASLEIPLSMAIAFIIMYLSDMNLNLISLGGLALAAGMNVDASVVVLENIFKHQEQWSNLERGELSFSQRLNLIHGAVKEVALPVFVSIATTLIVFIPLIMTTDLTNAILGDLAKAVVFSHGVSGLVAVVVVPTIRLLLMPKNLKVLPKAPLERPLRWLEKKYLRALGILLKSPKAKLASIFLPFALCASLVWLIVPKLPKEIVGTPDTDWIYLWMKATKAENSRHFENILQETESRALELEDGLVLYTFVQAFRQNEGSIMLRLKNKSDMDKVVKDLQRAFPNTPDTYYHAGAWNPAELPLPKMSHFELEITGKSTDSILSTASRTYYFLKELGEYDRHEHSPGEFYQNTFTFVPNESIWMSLAAAKYKVDRTDILDLTFYANEGKAPGSVIIDGTLIPIKIMFNDERLQTPEVLASYPFKLGDKVVPLSALGEFKTQRLSRQIYRSEGREKAAIRAKLDKEKEANWEALSKKYNEHIHNNRKELTGDSGANIEILPPQKELGQALEQLKTSLAISLLLIFLVLWLKFQSVKQVFIIMMTIPLGIIGVLVSLYIFRSTLSLNSALGVILLNGITVNNSILLMEVFNQMLKKDLTERDAVLEACRSRLRPIIITSLTTVLGMFPIAMGWGEGGKILQPLGIAVSFGMIFATAMTLFVVPIIMLRRQAEQAVKQVENNFSELDLYQESGVQSWQ